MNHYNKQKNRGKLRVLIVVCCTIVVAVRMVGMLDLANWIFKQSPYYYQDHPLPPEYSGEYDYWVINTKYVRKMWAEYKNDNF